MNVLSSPSAYLEHLFKKIQAATNKYFDFFWEGF